MKHSNQIQRLQSDLLRRPGLSNLLRWLVAFLMAVATMPVLGVLAQSDADTQTTSDLWMDISLGAPFVEWFNRTARPTDIARVDHLSQVDLLDQITVGRRLVVFKSVEEAEQYLPELEDKVDILGYNLEHGPANLAAEQADPVASVRRMRELADRYGIALAFGPDRSFALSDGVAIAEHVDLFFLQVQRVQNEPEIVRDFVQPLVAELRQANPELDSLGQKSRCC